MKIIKGEILKRYRENLGVSQKQLSQGTGIPRGTIAACEYRNTQIDRATARKYDDFFKVQKTKIQRFLDWLF